MTTMAYPEDPDFSSIDALPDPASAPKLSTELDGIATAIQTTTTGISGTAGGKTPDEVVSEANAAVTATRDLATVAAAIESATKILKDAAAAWKKNAPKKAELDAAQKAVDDAKAALKTAQEAVDKATDADSKYTADNAVATAEKDLRSALLELSTLQKKRKSADEAYEAARKRAMLVMKGVTTATDSSGEAPATETGTGSSAPSGAGNGRTAPSSGAPAAPSNGKPAGTPSPSSTASPTSTSPSSTTTSTSSGVDPSTAAIAALLAQQGQSQQPVQMPTQQAAAAPTATAPQQAGQQPSGQQAKNGKTDGVLDLDAVRELLGETAPGLALGLGGGGTHTESPASSAPAPSTNSTTFRPAGTPISGVGLGGAPAVNQQAPTSGNSATGLHTSSDVSGRSTPAATAYSSSPETKTSGATGTGAAQQQAAQQTGARPMGGMPMMPMTPMTGGAPAGGHRGDGEEKKITTYGEGGLLHGEDTIAEAVRGGTIAQNRPDTAA